MRFCIISLIFLTTMANSHISAMTIMDSEKTALGQAYNEMYRAMIAKDTAALGRMLSDDFVLVHMTGMRQAKYDYLRAIANGTLNYYSCDDTRLEISIEGESARIIGCSRVSAAVFGGGRHTWSLRLDIALKRQGGRWLMTEIKAGTY